MCTIFLSHKKYRSPCSFKRKGPSHLFNYTSPVTGNSHFEKERTDVFALSTISTLSLSFLLLPCHKIPPPLSNHAFPKHPFFSRAGFPARKAAIIFSCQLRVIMRSTGCAVQYWGITLKSESFCWLLKCVINTVACNHLSTRMTKTCSTGQSKFKVLTNKLQSLPAHLVTFWRHLRKHLKGSKVSGRDPFNQNFRKFRSKTQWIGSVQPEKFRKNGSTFWGGPLFPVGPVGILVEWIAPSLFYYPTRTRILSFVALKITMDDRKSIEEFLWDIDCDLLQYAGDLRKKGFTSTLSARYLTEEDLHFLPEGHRRY